MSEPIDNAPRNRILARLRRSRPPLGSSGTDTRADDTISVASARPRHRREAPLQVAQQRQLVSQLEQALLASHAEILHLGEAEWPGVLLELAQTESLHTWLCHPECEAGRAFGMHAENAGTIRLRHYAAEAGQAAGSLSSDDLIGGKAALFHEIDAGLSHAVAGIAETGTLLLFSSPVQPRLLSLVPPVHAVTLRYSAIQASMAECMAVNAVFHQRPLPANIIFISGPSKTADIQQTLAYGAHGPKRLIVMLIDDLEDLSSTSS